MIPESMVLTFSFSDSSLQIPHRSWRWWSLDSLHIAHENGQVYCLLLAVGLGVLVCCNFFSGFFTFLKLALIKWVQNLSPKQDWFENRLLQEKNKHKTPFIYKKSLNHFSRPFGMTSCFSILVMWLVWLVQTLRSEVKHTVPWSSVLQLAISPSWCKKYYSAILLFLYLKRELNFIVCSLSIVSLSFCV